MSQGFVNPQTITLPLPVSDGGTGVTTSTGTGSVVLSNSPTVTGLTSDQITWSDTTKGIVGTTTNNNAATGYVGEFVTSQATIASLTSGAFTDITSITLTAGDWDVYGNMLFATSANVGTQFTGWTDTTSSAYPGNFYSSNISLSSGSPTTSGIGFAVPTRRFSLSASTTIYLGGSAVFSSGTCSVEGLMFARRVR